MLYYFFHWLQKLDFPGAGIFNYISFRALMVVILALLISSIFGNKFIKLLKRKQVIEIQRDASVDPFNTKKKDIPSMGGIIIIVSILILAYVSSHTEFAGYLNIMYIPGSEELVIFICAFVGALIGFLWYNAFPAQIFMGDTGSLTIGGIIAVFAIIIHKELLIPILCGVFLVESASTIIQVSYFKLGKKKGIKQRVFKRTPIHDHFRTTTDKLESDCTYMFIKPTNVFHEAKITVRFWIVTIVLAAIAIITLKIR